MSARLILGGLLLLIGGSGLWIYSMHSGKARQRARHSRRFVWSHRIAVAFGGLSLYVLTALAVPSLERHTGDGGALQWLPSIPGAMTCLRIYVLPLAIIARTVPASRTYFDRAVDMWWEVLDPPDTTP